MCLDHTYRPPRALQLLVIALVALTGMFMLSAARAAPAQANIAWPYEFMPTIDGYQPYDGQTTCHSQPMPGVVEFRDYLNFWFGPHTAYINRACSSGGQSEHKEGRALDYMLPSTDPTSLKILANVLGTDKYGNAHALGRRFGLMYIISNRKMFRFYHPEWGWQPYNGSNPHTDHIHFSFSWPGALKQTSWWTTTNRTVKGCNSTIETWRFNSAFGPMVQIKKIKDGYGQTFDTQSEIKNSYWRTRVSGKQYFANQPLSQLGNPKPQAVLPLFSGGQCLVSL
jgi:hypothetical protein